MQRLKDKVALVTGSSRGIGRSTALVLAEEGADVVINYLSHPDEAKAVADGVRDVGQEALVYQADVANREAVEAMFARSVEHFGHLDVVVSNVGITIGSNVIDAKWEDFLRVIQVSQLGTFHVCQMAAQQMVKQVQAGRPGGKIVIMSSVHQEIPVPGHSAYNMSKAAINHFGRTLALELAPYHINVNIINPGWIDTPAVHALASEEQLELGAQRVPWKRLGRPEEIAKAVLYLVSDDADYVTGATLRVDGGYKIGLRLPLDD